MNKIKVLLLTMLLSYAGMLTAAPPESSEDKGLPRYLESEFAIVKEMLELNAQKMDALSEQIDGVKDELTAEIHAAKQQINDRIDILAADVDDVLFLLNEPDKDIQLTTEVCFDLGASWDWALSSKASLGVGWDNVVKIDAFAELSGPGPLPILTPVPPTYFTTIPVIPAVSAGVAGTLCVNVPLYSVASNDYWGPKFDTEEFDDLIRIVATPAQGVLPGLAHVYGKVMPDVTPAIEFLDDGLNLIIRDEGLSDRDALINASESFVNLMNSPMIKTMVDQSTSVIGEGWLDLLDPLCTICWVIPH
jgi:hypothetical protein